MKTKTTITVEKWEYTAVRMKREPVKTICRVCGEEGTLLSVAENPSSGSVSEATENNPGEERLIRLRPLDQQ